MGCQASGGRNPSLMTIPSASGSLSDRETWRARRLRKAIGFNRYDCLNMRLNCRTLEKPLAKATSTAFSTIALQVKGAVFALEPTD
jgi:hypothetical protein